VRFNLTATKFAVETPTHTDFSSERTPEARDLPCIALKPNWQLEWQDSLLRSIFAKFLHRTRSAAAMRFMAAARFSWE
jgi:hypothetical protein